jgi:hypothetical protein
VLEEERGVRRCWEEEGVDKVLEEEGIKIYTTKI